MNRYRKGARLEYRTMKILEWAGYTCTRAAGSHGPIDIVAFDSLRLRLVQVKANGWGTPLEREELELLPVPANCTKEIWRWDDRAREPLIRVLGKTQEHSRDV